MVEFRFCGECEKIFGGGTKCPHCGAALELKEPSFFIGRSFGKYNVEGILGHGGMGMVYLARHTVLGRLAALKIILPELGEEGDTFLARFLREAQLLAQLKHRAIVDIYDFDVSDWGLPYYAMEYVEGISLRNLLAQYGKLFNVNDYSAIFREIASALDYAHEKGVVHRDLKPENIIIALSDGKPAAKILDFGIAKIILEGEAGKTLTGEGNVIGTLNYIAPEQVLGGKISGKTDQYSLALIVAETMSGRPVREGKTLGEICASDIQSSLKEERLPESAPESVKAAIKRATEKEPDRRFGTVSDFISALGLEAPEKQEKLVSLIQRETVGCSPTITPMPSDAVISKLTPGKVPKKTKVSEKKEPSRQEKKKKGWLKYAVLGSAALAVLGMTWFLFFDKSKKSAEPEKKKQAVCEKTGEWAVPPDASSVLSSVDGRTALLKGGRSLYLVNLSSNQMPSMIPLAADEVVLGTTPAGDPVIAKPASRGGTDIVERSVSESREKPICSFGNVEPGSVTLSRSLRTVSTGRENRNCIFREFNGTQYPLATIDLPEAPPGQKIRALSDKYFAVFSNDKIWVYDIKKGGLLFQKEIKERVFGLYLDDISDKLALWGWFDRIELYSLPDGSYSDIKVTGETKDVLIIPDRPTLAAAGNYGIKFWDISSSKLLFESAGGESYSSLLSSPTGVFAISAGNGTMSRYALRSVFPARTVKICDKELWSLADDPKEKKVFAGGSDGKIYIVPDKGEATSKELHTLGVTSIVLSGDSLISSSDDKTIAVFRMPSFELQYRSTAHTFLINHLLLSGSPPKLWSSSSDGHLKSWSLPNLEEQLSISVSDLLGKKTSLHAFWISPDEKRVLIGTWNDMIVFLKKEGAGFVRKIFEIPSHAGISASEVRGRDLVAIAGVNDRSAIYIFDLRTEELYILPELTGSPYAFSVFPSGEDGTVLLCPFGELMRLRFDRDPDGRISYSSSLWVSPDIGCSGISILGSDQKTVITATDSGEVLWIDLQSLGPSNRSKGFLSDKIAARAGR